MSENRANERKSVGLLVKLSYGGVDEFAQKYATNLSDGGMFVRTREPKAVGAELAFKVEIANGQRVLQGKARVQWVRAANDPAGPAGMGLQFVQLDEASRALVDRMIASTVAQKPPSIAPVAKPPGVPALEVPIEIEAGPRENEIELDLDSLLATTPEPPAAPPFESSPSSFELDIELDVDVAPAAPPPPPPIAKPAAPKPVVVAPPPPVPAPPAPAPPPPRAPAPPPPAPPAPAPPAPAPPAPAPPAPAPPAPAPPAPAPPPPAPRAAPPLTGDAALAALPQIRREPPRPAPAVAAAPTLTAPVAPPAPSVPKTGPVYLKPGPIDPTGAVIGIDLGTTNSACAIVNKGRPQILRSKDGYNTIPSIVALNKQGKLEVGHRARGQMVLNPTQSVFGAKRLVGRDYDSPTVRHFRERSHFEIVPDDQNRAAVRLGNDTLTLEEVQGLILRECREMAEQTLGQKISRAVVTCPAYYSEPQREAVRRAGAMAGLKIERVLNEPTAAALAFGMNREMTRTVLVYDLGGGTFDATLLKIDKNVFEVLATGGDVFLGGVDFDNQIVDALLQRFQTQHGRPFAGDQVALSRIAEIAEKAKMALSEQNTFDVHLPMLELEANGTPRDLKCTITRADVEAACKQLVERTILAVQDVLLDAKLKPAQLDDIILVGGMSRMPMVREHLKTLFKKPPHASVNADEAVALGAALYSGSVDKVSSLVLIDVVPMTVGLGKPGGGFHRLIERNTPLPATKSFGISTHQDDQTDLEVLIFQGEDSNVAGNEFLGALKVTGLPKGPKGAVQIAITVSLDAECVLKVEAREFKTRKVVQATLATRYTPDEVAQRLQISSEKRAQTDQKRSDELGQRTGGFWSKLKRVFSRK